MKLPLYRNGPEVTRQIECMSGNELVDEIQELDALLQDASSRFDLDKAGMVEILDERSAYMKQRYTDRRNSMYMPDQLRLQVR